MNMDRTFAWYLLLHVRGLGPKGVHKIYDKLKKDKMFISDLFNLSRDEFWKKFPIFQEGRYKNNDIYENIQRVKDNREIREGYRSISREEVTILTLEDKEYPKILKKQLGDEAPPVLFVKGNINILCERKIAIIGSRNTQDALLDFTSKLAGRLAQEGYDIVSGYAKGVDTYAHKGALEVEGTTTAVLSYGIKHLSYKRVFDKKWRENIVFVSQFLPHEKWKAANAMIRNKVVCGFSTAVVVIASGRERDEEGKMSGTFAAAKFAIEKGIPVFVLSHKAIPNLPKGNQELIAMGGREFESIEELKRLIELTGERQSLDMPQVKRSITGKQLTLPRFER